MKHNLLKITFLMAIVSLASCKYQKNNTIDQADVRKADVYVYGVHPDSAAVQTKKQYSSTPELDQRTIAIREKMFGASSVTNGN
jgi:hypothetical protein